MKARTYEMAKRTVAAEQTGDRIVDAMLARFAEAPYDRIRLEDVAADAGVTVQTVLRRFESKAALMGVVVRRELGVIAAARAEAGGGDVEPVVVDLVAHYEQYGALILKAYNEAPFIDGLPELVAAARSFHLSWCREAFSPHLAGDLDRATRKRRLAQVTAICDATTWRILRHDLGLSKPQVAVALGEMLAPLLEAA